MAELAAITIDVDSLSFYRQIHGLPPRPLEDDPIYTVAVPRFFELLDELQVPATLFLIGQDAPPHAERFRPAHALGAEIASHSFAHDYHLSRRAPAAIRDDLERAQAALSPLAPSGISGFRAPGYNVSPALLQALSTLGYAYDSSLLPSPLYFGARLAAIAAYRALGRRSASLVGDVRAYAGPLVPYRASLDRPARRATGGPDLIEIPIACEPRSRVPIIGTSWVLTPAPLRRALLVSTLRRLPVFNFEMHAIDLLDASDRGVTSELAAAQRDLAVPATAKMRAFRALFRALADHAELTTLRAIAARFGR